MIGLRKGDIDIAARTVWGEARGEGWGGMVAVAWVLKNRSQRRWGRGNTLAQVCQQEWQFSCWNPGDPNRAKLFRADESDGTFLQALGVVLAVVLGHEPDPTGGADHYLTKAAYRNAPPEHWCRQYEQTAEIGNHLFFRE